MLKQTSMLSRVCVGLLAVAVLVLMFALTVRAEDLAAPADPSTDTAVINDTPAPEETGTPLPETPPEEEAVDDVPVVTDPVTEPPPEEQAPLEEPPAEEANTNVAEPEAPATETPIEEAAPSLEEAAAPTLSTDKDDYHPGQIATIIGRFFSSLTDYVVKVFGSDENGDNYTETSVAVTADENGMFSFEYQLDNVYRPIYEMAASTLEGLKVAESYFRDSSIGTYDQCSNDDGDGYATGDTGCRWTTGNIQANNSTYFEGDATVQRLWIEGYVPGSSHTVTFKYGTTKAGSHAYDYLTTWSDSENWATDADRCQDITGCTSASDSTVAMQDDPNVDNTIEPSAASRLFTIRGGTVSSVSVPTIVSGSYAGDSETSVTVSFTVGPSSGSMCSTKKVQGQDVTSCGIALWFGAHVAEGAEWTVFNGTTGAGSIQGSPYHVALDQEDGASIGQRDNQMAAAAIVQSGSITIIKDAVPNDAQDFNFTTTGAGLSAFSLDDDANGTLSNTQTFTGLTAGTYTVTEGAVAGWNLTGSVTCTDPTSNSTINLGTRTASINLAAGENVTCTFVNTLQQGTLIVNKVVVNDSGGTADADDFSFQVNGDSSTPFESDGSNSVTVNAGTYTVTEPAVVGYATTYNNCSSVNVPAGGTATCTITNDDIAPTLMLVKTVTNDNGGTATAVDFQGKIDGNNVAWGVAQAVSAGAHTASETALTDYAAGNWGGDCAANGSITLALGESKTCTITNDDIAPQLTVIKHVVNDNDGPADAGDFTMNVTATNPSSGSFAGSESPGTTITLDAGAYSVDEGSVTGYAKSLSADCSGTIALGESKTCTITNDDIQPKLTVTKVVVNDNGGTKTIVDFPLFVGATGVTSGVENGFDAGSYVVTETPDAGYTSVVSGDCDLNGNVTLGVGDVKSCTITNDDRPGTLHVIKTVVNDNGGTLEADDFSFQVNGDSAISFEADGQNDLTVNAGTYDIIEPAVTGYATSYSTCDDVVITNGGEATCTITNDDIAPQLTVIKHVVNDNGGGAVAGDFTMNVTATSPSQASFLGNESPGTTITLHPGSYSVDEGAVSGYTKSLSTDCSGTIALGESKTCTITNDDQQAYVVVDKTVVNDNGGGALPDDFDLTVNGNAVLDGIAYPVNPGTHTAGETNLPGYTQGAWGGDCTQNRSVTVALGETKTCTITNDDQQAFVTVVKVVVNDNGGDALPDDFDLTLGSDPVSSGVAVPVDPGTYTAGETGLPGYEFSGFTGDCDQAGDVTVALGESKTCTITNDDIAPSLTLVKQVVNDSGGSAVATDWTLSAAGPTPLSGAGGAASDATFDAGTYTLSESGGPQGYTASAWSCVGGNQNGSDITLNVGESATCTITNDDQQAFVTVVKVVTNDDGGTAAPDDFALTLEGNGASSGVQVPVNPGTYTAAETQVAGYTFEGFSGDCDQAGDVTVALGESKTCTLTNNDQPGHLIVHKVTDPNSDTTTQFSLTLDSAPDTGNATQNIVGGGTVDYTVNAGTYSVSEAALAGWDITGNTCANIAVANGETEECTITNTKRGSLTIVKDAQPNDLKDFVFGGTLGSFTLDDDAGVSDIGLNGDVDRPNSQAFTNLVPGSYTVSETLPNSFWLFGGVSCTGNATATSSVTNGVTVTVNPGENVTCTFTNIKVSPTRTQGFWQTHTSFTGSIVSTFVGGLMIGNNGLHKGPVTTNAQVMGAYWSNLAQKTVGGKRADVDKTRMQLLQQLVTAKLNCKAFGCPASITSLIASADAAFAAGNIASMLALSGQLDAYNNSGDTVIISPFVPGKATPKNSQSIADKAFWNAP